MLLCNTLPDHIFLVNLLVGVWDGLTAIISLALSLFFQVSVYGVCYGSSWFYNLGFTVGIAIGIVLGLNRMTILLIVLVACLIIKILALLFVPLVWGVGIAIGILIFYWAFLRFGGREMVHRWRMRKLNT